MPVFLVILVLFLTVVAKWMSSKSGGQILRMPPGPWKLPIIGNLHQLIGVSMYHHKFTNLAKIHGPIVHLQICEISAVLISSPELAEHVLRTNELNFAQRPQLLDEDIIPYKGSSLIFSPYNEYWKHIRRITMSDLLGLKRVQTFKFVREAEVENLVETIYGCAGNVFNLSKHFYTLSNNIITKSVLGNKSIHQEEFRNALDEMTSLTGNVRVHDLFPSLKFLHFVTWKRVALRRVFKRLDKILDAIIDEHKAVNQSRSEEKDLLDLLLNVYGCNNSSSGLTIDNIKNYVLDIFAGGSKPTRAILEWTMSELLKNPRTMEKAQAEVRSSVEGKGKVEEVDTQSLPYLNSIIKETFRLHMPGPLIPREARENCKISGYDIPMKTRIFVNQWAMSRDPKYWSNAESFDPERFLMSSTDNIHGMEYIPFGAGRRICPGESFALVFIRLALFQLLLHFDWKLPNGIGPLELDMSESYDITTRRKIDLYVVAVPVHGTVMPNSNASCKNASQPST
ncbi:melianol synthase CYP71BQ5-like [Apium graveolens]|uniref:melianol synthase CYP71BQ5-like n=1 Tax=Apium graveolens TaxID=4045 RepID=UPI003D7B6DD2